MISLLSFLSRNDFENKKSINNSCSSAIPNQVFIRLLSIDMRAALGSDAFVSSFAFSDDDVTSKDSPSLVSLFPGFASGTTNAGNGQIMMSDKISRQKDVKYYDELTIGTLFSLP